MKILYHHRIASKDGQYVHVAKIIESLRELGAEVRIVAPAMSEKQRFGGETRLVARLKSSLPKALYELLELGYSVLDFVKLAAALRAFRPDVIYERYNLFFPSGVLASKLFRVPLILEVNAPLFEERSRYGGLALTRLARWTERFAWRRADVVLPVTGVLAQMIEREGVPADRLQVIPNGIDRARLSEPAAAVDLPRFGEDAVVVGFVGFCREWHELDKVVDLIAADESRRLAFVVVGDGPAIPGLKAQADALGCADRVHFAGLVEHDLIPAWLATIDIALQPAVVPYACPLKLIDYLGAGKAIVAPDQDNIRELLTHEHDALLFPPGDTEAFISAIRRLAGDVELRARLAAEARRTLEARALFWDENGRRILRIAERLADGRVALEATARE